MSETKTAKTKTQRPFVFFVLLIRENDKTNNRTGLYIYDNAGNIDAKYVFNNSTAPMSHLVTMLSAADSTVDYSYNGDDDVFNN